MQIEKTMLAALAKSASTAKFTTLKSGSVMGNSPKGISQSTMLLILVIILLIGLYFYGKSRDKKVKTNNTRLGEDATISGSQATNYANTLEGYLASGWTTTSSEFNNAMSLINSFSNSDLIAVNNAYSKGDYEYDSLSRLLNAQYTVHRSSSSVEQMELAVEKLRNAGI